MSATDRALMERIQQRWGALIADVAKLSSVPPALLAALIANESGGDPHAKRFESGVLVSLWQVLQGRTAAFGSLRAGDLLTLFAAPGPAGRLPSVTEALQRIDGLANSQGLTQIMGYNALNADLADPRTNLARALTLLGEFAKRFGLELHEDFAGLLRCWNTGGPNGITADPQYVDNALARMAIYEEITAKAAQAGIPLVT